jgi:hypothetical protein
VKAICDLNSVAEINHQIRKNHRPFIHDSHRGKIKHFQEIIVGDKGAFCFRDFPKLQIKIFNSVDRINQFSDFRRIFEHGRKFIPVDTP